MKVMKIIRIQRYIFFLILLFTLHGTSSRYFSVAADATNQDEIGEKVYISPECAVVLVTAGTTVGGVATWGLAGPAGPILSHIGFTTEGLAKGSFAAWWQSTLPLVKAGSLFSSLQSIASLGIGSTVIISRSIGGAAVASQLRGMCKYIDDVDPKSPAGLAILSLLKVEGNFGTLWAKFNPSEETLRTMNEHWNNMKNVGSDQWDQFGFSKDTQKRFNEYWDNMKEYGFGAWSRFKKNIVPGDENKGMWLEDIKDVTDAISDVWNKMKDRRARDDL